MLLNLIPAFGKKPDKDIQISFKKRSKNYENGRFYFDKNSEVMESSFKSYLSMIKDQIIKKPRQKPGQALPIKKIEKLPEVQLKELAVTWFGHSTFIVQMSNKTILVDPMLGEIASPFSFAGVRRFNKDIPISIENLPYIDIVLISHDHYDHLDYATIKGIDKKVGTFYVPLGIEGHLKRWGVDSKKIVTMSWWDETKIDCLTIACTPSKHFSGRSINDSNATLWASWVLKNDHNKLFYSGDTGYANHFKKISEKYGAFDLVLLECGQFDERWKGIHMLPKQTVQAAIDLKADTVFPIHWGAFKLAFHEWDYPIKAFLSLAKPYNLTTITPIIGETVIFDKRYDYCTKWWQDIN